MPSYNNFTKPKFVLTSVAMATGLSLNVNAQTSTEQTQENIVQEVEELIVVGTPGGQGISRQDAAFAVTAISADEISRIAPASSSDLLKNIPGVWVESSGGSAAGANIDVRGLPGGGDTPFVTQSINGSPLFGQSAGISFFATDALVRIDESVVGVEAVRGGPGSVFARGESGLTVNYRLREGSETPESGIKITTALNHDENRIDAYTSGPLSEDDLFYSVAGYVRGGSGVRDTGFDSEEGFQFTGQLTKVLDNGKVNIYGRVTDDHGQWVLPIALDNPNLDLGTFAQLGIANRQRTINFGSGIDGDLGAEAIAEAQAANPDLQVANNVTFDFADGRGFDGVVLGGNFELELTENITLRNNVNFLEGTNRTLGLVPSGGAVTVGSVLGNQDAIGAGINSLQASGRTLDAGEFVQTYGFWVVFNELEHFSNDFSINWNNGTHNVTGGLYISSFGNDAQWSIGNPAVLENTAGGGAVSAFDAAGTSLGELDPSLVNGGFNFNVNQTGDANVVAFYIADEVIINDALTIDGAVRFETFDIVYQGDFGGILDGVNDQEADIDDDEVAFTFGANYAFNDNFGGFARFSDGFRLPGFDNIREGNFNVFDVEQAEVGLKYSSGRFDIYGTVFYATSDQFDNAVGGANNTGAFETETIGIEIEGNLRFGELFNIAIIGTFQDTEITEADAADQVGNSILRQPDVQFLLRPTYTQEFGEFEGSIFGSVQFIDDRFGDNANLQPLDSFTEVGLGASIRHSSGIYGQLNIDNLTDDDGFTEGDPRAGFGFNARPIFGRSVKLSIGYDF